MLFYPVIPTIAVPASRATRQCTRGSSASNLFRFFPFPSTLLTSTTMPYSAVAKAIMPAISIFLLRHSFADAFISTCLPGLARLGSSEPLASIAALGTPRTYSQLPYPPHTQIKRKNNSTCRPSAPEPYDHSSVSQRHLSSQIRLLEFLLFFYITRALLYPPRALPRSHRK